MFKNFVKKFEETTGSIKGSIFNTVNKDQQQPVSSTIPETNTPTNSPINNDIKLTPTHTATAATTIPPPPPPTTNTTGSNNASPTIYNLQPVVDVIKESVVQPVTDVLKMKVVDVEAIKEFTSNTEKDLSAALQNMTSSVTNTVTNTVASSGSSNLPSIAQLKDSLQDVDLYNGSLLLRSYEIKLKQMRTNGVILAERAEEVDKKIFPLVKTCTAQAECWKKAQTELTKLDDLNNMVESITLTLESIVSKIEALEISLSVEIENYLDQQHAKWKEQKELEFIRYESLKKAELIKFEEDVINTHNKHEKEKAAKEKLAQQEQERLARKKQDEELQRKIKEEANIRSNLDKTIQKQLNDYKTSGIIPTTTDSATNDTTSSSSSSQPTTTIEQIVPEDNKEDLEKFLAPTPPTSSPTLTSQDQPAPISTEPLSNPIETPAPSKEKEEEEEQIEEKKE